MAQFYQVAESLIHNEANRQQPVFPLSVFFCKPDLIYEIEARRGGGKDHSINK